MTSQAYKHHIDTIKWYNKLVDILAMRTEGTADYLRLLIKLTQIKGYIKKDLQEAERNKQRSLIKTK